jgi:hypothetical protein
MKELLDSYIWTRYAETPQLGHQCVWFAKKFVSDMWRWSLWRFWWSANKWWINGLNTFDKSKRDKIYNTPSIYPQMWDIVFFEPTKSNPYWHVWVVYSATLDSMDVVSQNWLTGNGSWIWGDAIVHRNYSYVGCSWRYSYKKNDNTVATQDFWKLDQELQEAKDKGIWNWERGDEYITRWDCVRMIIRATR